MRQKVIEQFFDLKQNKTTIKIELFAAITSFLATAYIIVVNPTILANAGMSFPALVTSTILVCAFSSIMMGLFANLPIIVAPGMGLNAFFAFSLVISKNVSYQVALGAVFWSGIIFLLLSLFKIREKIIDSIPDTLKKSISCGIGLFISTIGLTNVGFIIPSKATIFTHGPMNLKIVIFLFGLAICSYLIIKKNKAAFLIGMVVTTILSAIIGEFSGAEKLVNYNGLFALPDFSLLLQIDFLGSLKFSFIPVIFAFVFTDLFDSISTFVGVAEAANLKDGNGKPKNISKALIADSISTTFSGLVGSSPGTGYIESAAGIAQGGRTGLVAVIAGILFIPFLFLSPLISMIPSVATAPVLVIVGVYMMTPIAKINWEDLEVAIPSFLAILLIPLSYSITNGIIWGFLIYTIIKLMLGKYKELNLVLIGIDLFAILSLI